VLVHFPGHALRQVDFGFQHRDFAVGPSLFAGLFREVGAPIRGVDPYQLGAFTQHHLVCSLPEIVLGFRIRRNI